MDQGQVLLQTLGAMQNLGVNTDASLEPIPEQQDGSEPDTQAPEPRTGPPLQADIEFRIKELHNRHFLLLEMQRFWKKIEGNGVGTTEGVTCEDSGQLCELKAIQRELDELQGKKDLEKQRNGLKLTANEGQQGTHPTYKTETPRGGIYMLPPPQLAEEDLTLESRGKMRPAAEKRPADSVIPVDFLGQTPAFTKCPSCEEVVFTETCSKVGLASWTICFLCALTGCVAGCCLIPFCMSRLKNVQHQCPQCRAIIHTHQPF